jgi:signal peptidase II
MRWPTFNVADMAVSIGAFLLAWVLWGEERAERAATNASVAPETQRST